jgi:hypothetical protein
VPVGDEYGPAWRQLYFFRGMCHTSREIQSVIQGLSKEEDFKQFLKKQPKDFVRDFNSLKINLNKALNTIEAVRDEITAHIKQTSTQQALENMSEKRSGFLQVSFESPRKTHYKFTGELLLAIMFKDIPPEHQQEEAIERINLFVNGVQNLLQMVDILFFSYAKERGLFT